MSFDIREAILIFIRGLLMGSADIVPGVSGGTIALITGIYAHLVEAISRIRFGFVKPLLKGDINGFITGIFDEIEFKVKQGNKKASRKNSKREKPNNKSSN